VPHTCDGAALVFGFSSVVRSLVGPRPRSARGTVAALISLCQSGVTHGEVRQTS
jgi:hypothetical protein